VEAGMRAVIVLLAAVVLSGCVSQRQAAVEPAPEEPVLYFDLEVPGAFQSEVHGWSHGMSGCQRYMEGFTMGWWRCVDDYRRDINYQSTRADYIVSGWGEFISGFSEGYRSAERQIEWNIKTFGPERTHAYLVEITANIMAE
jgi:hypothetical protein